MATNKKAEPKKGLFGKLVQGAKDLVQAPTKGEEKQNIEGEPEEPNEELNQKAINTGKGVNSSSEEVRKFGGVAKMRVRLHEKRKRALAAKQPQMPPNVH